MRGLALVAALVACDPPLPSTTDRGPEASSPSEPETISIESDGLSIRASLYRPTREGRSPVLVYNHGSERDPGIEWLGTTARFFQENGYAVVLPYRRGANGSEGTYWRDVVDQAPAEDKDRVTIEQLEIENADVGAAVRWARAQPFADADAVSVAGCSFGGIHSILAAERVEGVRAAVSFAGAAMSWQGSPAIRERLIGAARSARVPIFFVQAENDYDTTPSRALSDEMRRAGLPVRMRIFPAHGTTNAEGHAHFCNHGQSEWGPDVLDFLRTAPSP